MEINPRLNVLAIAKPCFLLRLGEFLARFISPAALFKERIQIEISSSLGRRPCAKHHSRISSFNPPPSFPLPV
jgi:hypothetical protein